MRWSELRTTLPEYLTFKTITRGTLPFAVEESRTVPYSTVIRHPQLSDERLTGLGPGAALGTEGCARLSCRAPDGRARELPQAHQLRAGRHSP